MEETKQKKKGTAAFWKEKGKLAFLVIGVLLGVLFLLLGGKEETTSAATSDESESERLAALAQYEKALESEIEAICESVAGVSGVKVIVTFSSGARVVYTTDASGNPATVGSGSAKTPLYRTIEPPAVSGVGIVCRGGDDPEIKKTLTELLSTALGIGHNRVYVTGK